MAANDLIAGVYEGGFKTWEGGLDLAQLLAAALQQQPPPAELGAGSRVMELVGAAAALAVGCHMLGRMLGAPLPACLPACIAACIQGLQAAPARHVLTATSTALAAPLQGCGSGLPGLVALWAGAEVHFQVGG